MKRFILIVLCLFMLVSCDKHEEHNKNNGEPANLKEIIGVPLKADLNEDGNIVIEEAKITNQVVYYTYEYEGVIIGLLAVRNSSGKVIVVVNTCQSCGGSPYAYFVQDNEYVQCQNCGNMFLIDDLDHLEKDGCNPIEIEDLTRNKGKIIIGTEQLKELKGKFENWKGPKA